MRSIQVQIFSVLCFLLMVQSSIAGGVKGSIEKPRQLGKKGRKSKKEKKMEKEDKKEKVKKVDKKSRKKAGKRSKIGNTLVGKMGLYPGYSGDLMPDGKLTLRFNDDESFLLKMNVDGLEADCVNCGVHVHVGSSCSLPDTVGPHYWDVIEFPDDPWNTEGFYNTTSMGMSTSGFVIDSGHGFSDNNGRTVVIHDSTSSRVACGELRRTGRGRAMSMYAEMGAYPEYTGELIVSGDVFVDFFMDDSFEMIAMLEGLRPNCDKCGIHIHSGTTCDTASMVGGHYWNTTEFGNYDPWNTDDRTYYTSDAYGMASRGFFLYSGFNFDENVGHAVVVHDQDGTRISCGILYAM